MNEQNTTSFLQDFLLRRKLNLSNSSWDQFNNKWHDEIYVTSKNDLFKRPRTNRKPKIFSSIKEIRIESESESESKENNNSQELNDNMTILKLVNQMNDLQLHVLGLTVLNIGLMTYCLLKS